jgi:hypothetical protein
VPSAGITSWIFVSCTLSEIQWHRDNEIPKALTVKRTKYQQRARSVTLPGAFAMFEHLACFCAYADLIWSYPSSMRSTSTVFRVGWKRGMSVLWIIVNGNCKSTSWSGELLGYSWLLEIKIWPIDPFWLPYLHPSVVFCIATIIMTSPPIRAVQASIKWRDILFYDWFAFDYLCQLRLLTRAHSIPGIRLCESHWCSWWVIEYSFSIHFTADSRCRLILCLGT